MKIKMSEQTKENIKAYTISGLIIICVWFLFDSWSNVAGFFGHVFSALKPFLLGFCLCFILVPMRNIVEDKWLRNTKLKQRSKRKLAVTVSIIFFILILVCFFAILIPQLTDSTKQLIENMDGYVKGFNDMINSITKNGSQYSKYINDAYGQLQTFVSSQMDGASGIFNKVVSFSVGFVKGVCDFFVGLIVAIYLLLDQEKFKYQLRRFNYAHFSKEYAEHLTEVGSLSNRMFNNFIFGKALDSLVVGIICYISCLLMHMPYASLISFVIGLTNMIPFFGPFLGAIPCIFILLIINPAKSLEFAIFVLALQQVDGNILGPYILGDSMGLPALWVMFAIICGGAMFGIIGMFLGVPLFSVIYVLVKGRVDYKIHKRNVEIPGKVEVFDE